jgi:hypothetical protein
MPVFFTKMHGTDSAINSDHVVEIRQVKNMASNVRHGHRPYITLAVLSDGRSEELLWDVDKCVKACRPIIPAYPGFEVLSPWRDKDKTGVWTTGVWRIPVIGWRADELGVEPVTADEDFEMSANASILYPDGQVVIPYDRTYPNEEEWLKEIERVFEQERLDTEQAAAAAAAEQTTEKAAS